MKKYIIAFSVTIATMALIHLYVVVNVKNPECIKSLTLYNTNTPDSINHLGVPVEKFCTEWNK